MSPERPLAIWIRRGLIVLVSLMPFHAFLVVWFGHLVGHQAWWQSWKEVLLLILAVMTLALVVKQPGRLQRLRKPVWGFVGLFVLIAVVVTTINRPPLGETAFGLKTDLEFLLAAAIAQLAAGAGFGRQLVKSILISSGIVIGFGLLQITLLPRDWLVHFGYGPTTVQPYQLVDPVLPAVRILSTLGGPNQLGSFLLLPLALVLWQVMRRPRLWQVAYIAAGLTVLWHTYSRSAVVGFVAVVGTLILIRVTRKWRIPLLLGGVLAAAIALQFITATRGINEHLQYYLYHQNLKNHNNLASTDLHLQAYQAGLAKAKAHPLGNGLGTAGPASFHGDNPNIPENYYLQIALETGVIGLASFLLFELFWGWELWLRKDNNALAAPALAALVGVSVINLALHGWTDSSTALVFWTASGAVLGEKV